MGNDSLVDYVRKFTEIWYSNYSLTMCMDDLVAARERAHDPFKLGRFCDEMDAFRMYTGKSPIDTNARSTPPLPFRRSGSDDIRVHPQLTAIDRQHVKVSVESEARESNACLRSIVHNEHEWHNRPSTYQCRLTVRAKRTIKKPYGHGNLLLPQYHHHRQQTHDFDGDFYGEY